MSQHQHPTTPPVPLTLLSGFLGAGKTTVLNRILAGDHGLRIAVMVNDFGNLDIAEELIAGESDGALKLTNGCICCSLKEDLVSSVMAVLHRDDRPQHIVLEASGVADPTGIATTLLAPVLRSAIRLDGVICVVDAQQFSVDHPEHDLILRQLMVSDLILLNKVDTVPDTERQRIDRQIHAWLSGARVLHTVHGNAPLPVLLSSLHAEDPERRVTRAFDIGVRHRGRDDDSHPDRDSEPGHTHEHEHEHEDTSAFDVWYYRTTGTLSAPALQELARNLPRTIYRIKGLARVADSRSGESPEFMMVQGVGRRLHLVRPRSQHADVRTGSADGRSPEDSRLVVIGAAGALDAEALQRAFDGACMTAGTDRHVSENDP